jgi:arylsulfatase A-like enzyme/Tfp pilus assembly protein PilF
MKRLVLILFGVVIVAVPSWGQTTAARKSPPDVYLITIDTLRADHVSCYGYKQVETPALDALAVDGVRFTQAFTHSPITNTSHITILTGLLPSVHGVTDFGVPLSPQHVTAAELLKQHGYHTAAFIGAVILDSNSLAPGLDRGFDFYDNFPKTDGEDGGGKNAGGKSSGEDKADSGKNERWGRVERRGMEVVEHAEGWFEKHRTGPHFVWVHLYDPHDPYEPPAPFSEKYKDHLYDGEIAYADSAVAHWIAYLKKAGVYDNAIIVVTGDHGEGLGEHGEETHGLFLYDSTLHVPLILKMPLKSVSAAQSGSVVDALVRTTDILPTILSVTGVAAPAELNGESLLPLIDSSNNERNHNHNNNDDKNNEPKNEAQALSSRTLFGETDYPLRWGWAPLRALRTDNAKWIEAPQPELYDLQADPKELKNLYSPHGTDSKAQDMQTEIAKWEAKLPARNNAEVEAALPDPKDKIDVQNLLHRAMLAADDHRSSEARPLLERALQIDPTSATAFRQLGELELADKDFSKAAVHLKRASELHPDDSTDAFELGEALEKSGDWPGARDALESSLKISPSQTSARLLLGHVYLQLKDGKNAEDQFEAALLVDSNNSDGRLGLAEAQILQSNFAAALPDLEAFTKSDPRNAAALRLLVRTYRGLGREQDAVRTEARAAAIEKK